MIFDIILNKIIALRENANLTSNPYFNIKI